MLSPPFRFYCIIAQGCFLVVRMIFLFIMLEKAEKRCYNITNIDKFFARSRWICQNIPEQ